MNPEEYLTPYELTFTEKWSKMGFNNHVRQQFIDVKPLVIADGSQLSYIGAVMEVGNAKVPSIFYTISAPREMIENVNTHLQFFLELLQKEMEIVNSN